MHGMRIERMCTPDKTPIREEQPGQEQLLHEEHLHIQNMEIMMFFGTCYEEQCICQETTNYQENTNEPIEGDTSKGYTRK
jgi:hypothetical protein